MPRKNKQKPSRQTTKRESKRQNARALKAAFQSVAQGQQIVAGG